MLIDCFTVSIDVDKDSGVRARLGLGLVLFTMFYSRQIQHVIEYSAVIIDTIFVDGLLPSFIVEKYSMLTNTVLYWLMINDAVNINCGRRLYHNAVLFNTPQNININNKCKTETIIFGIGGNVGWKPLRFV